MPSSAARRSTMGERRPGDDGDLDAGALQQLDAQTVLDVEGLELLAVVAVGDAPVREDAVDVQGQQRGCAGGVRRSRDARLEETEDRHDAEEGAAVVENDQGADVRSSMMRSASAARMPLRAVAGSRVMTSPMACCVISICRRGRGAGRRP
jgi:hypothetical protein